MILALTPWRENKQKLSHVWKFSRIGRIVQGFTEINVKIIAQVIKRFLSVKYFITSITRIVLHTSYTANSFICGSQYTVHSNVATRKKQCGYSWTVACWHLSVRWIRSQIIAAWHKNRLISTGIRNYLRKRRRSHSHAITWITTHLPTPKRWKAELADNLPTKWSHFVESPPAKDRRSNH